MQLADLLLGKFFERLQTAIIRSAEGWNTSLLEDNTTRERRMQKLRHMVDVVEVMDVLKRPEDRVRESCSARAN